MPCEKKTNVVVTSMVKPFIDVTINLRPQNKQLTYNLDVDVAPVASEVHIFYHSVVSELWVNSSWVLAILMAGNRHVKNCVRARKSHSILNNHSSINFNSHILPIWFCFGLLVCLFFYLL